MGAVKELQALIESDDQAEFDRWYKERERLSSATEKASNELKDVSGDNRGGLTPDHVKESPAFKSAKANFDKAFKAERDFNSKSPKSFQRRASDERRKERLKS